MFGIGVDVEIAIIKSRRKKSSAFVAAAVAVAFSSQNSIRNNVVLLGSEVVVGVGDHEVGVRAVDA